MKKLLFLFILICAANSLLAQQHPLIYKITADSVKITNDCDTAELIIENHTQNVPGFLFNKGRGRTEFRRATKLNDSTLILGDDTIVIAGGVTASNGLSRTDNNIQLGQSVGASGNPAMLTSQREIPLNGFKVNLNGTGALVVGTTSSSTAKLQGNSTTNECTLAAGPFLTNGVYNTFHSIDTVANGVFVKDRIMQVQRKLYFKDDGMHVNDKRATLFANLIAAKNSAIFDNDNGLFNNTISAGYYLQQYPGFTGTTSFTGPTVIKDILSSINAYTENWHTGSGQVVSTGFFGGYNTVIGVGAADTVEHYSAYSSGTKTGTGVIKNFYHHYMHNNPGVVNWGLYQEGASVKNFLEGNTGIGTNVPLAKLDVAGTVRITDTLKMPNAIAKSDTTNYKPVVIDASGNVYKMAGWNLSGTRKSATVTGSSYTVPADVDVVFVDYSSGQATVTLPAGTLDREITIKNLNTSNTVIISGLDTNDSNSIAIRGAITVKYTGSAWVGISKY